MTLELKGIENLDNKERLDYMVDFGKATIKTEADMIAMMANISSIIFNVVEDLNWAGFYLVKEDELVLGPFQGLPAVSYTHLIALIAGATDEKDYIEFAKTLDAAAKEIGVDFIGGYSALVHGEMTPADEILINSIPAALAETEKVCSSVNVGTTKNGLNTVSYTHLYQDPLVYYLCHEEGD